MECEYCDIIAGKSKSQILHQDEFMVIVAKDMVFTPGQITVFPRQHFTIMEQVPDEILTKCLVTADKASRAVFEVFQAEGTNIIIQNGLGAGQRVPHFALEVIPRKETDGLNLQWPPKEMNEDDLDITAHQLLEEIQKLGDFTAPKKKELPQEKEKKEVKIEEKEKGDNYLLKSVRRIP